MAGSEVTRRGFLGRALAVVGATVVAPVLGKAVTMTPKPVSMVKKISSPKPFVPLVCCDSRAFGVVKIKSK